MYDKQKLLEQISRHEGRVNHAYQDSEGYWTIGVGHLIDKRRGGYIPDFIIDALLEWDIQQVEESLDQYLPLWRSLDAIRQRVIVDMAFNIGVVGLSHFKRMQSALWAGMYDVAAKEMLDSKWARQVGRRAEKLAEMMKTGKE